MTDATVEERTYEWVEDVDSYIDDIIRQVGDNEMRAELAEIKTWPEAAKTAWLLDSDDQSDVKIQGAGGCAAVVVTIVIVMYWAWETVFGPDGVAERIRVQREREKEVEKTVHQGEHKNGKCPDDE